MEFVVAKNAGFCFGVKRAIDATYEKLENCDSEIYSIGPLIHNEILTSDLKEKGLIEVDNISDLDKIKNKVVILRTHGVERETLAKLKNNENEIIDLTCPFVQKIHNTVDEYSKEGYTVIVVGDKNHPEVKGIVSYANNDIYVVIDENDIKNLNIDRNSKVLVVFQTTTNVQNAQKLVDILTNLFYNIKIVNTICNATENRQNEVISLAKVCDVMLIIGSKTSSNTQKLYELSKKYCENTYLLSDKEDLNNIKLNINSKVGVSAGASTPKYLIEEILRNVRN